MNAATICVVDDDEAVLDSVSLLLTAVGYSTKTKCSGHSLLEDSDLSSFGCVILDLRLPDISGLDVLKRLRERYENLPVIMVTGHGDVPLAVQAMRIGAFDFIEKPYSDDVLLDRVQEAVAGSLEARGDTKQWSSTLTPRECEVLEQLVIGRPNKVIARELGISPRTVEIHRARVMEKTRAKSLSHLVRMALASGIDLDEPA